MEDQTQAYGFLGEFEHSIDDKNRVILPSSIRDCLESNERLILTPGFDDCLFLYPYQLWESLLQSDELQGYTENPRQLRRAFTAMAHESAVDGQGRLLIPDRLKGRAGIDDTVTVVGNFDRVEFWSPDTWEEYQQEIDMEDLAQTVFGASS